MTESSKDIRGGKHGLRQVAVRLVAKEGEPILSQEPVNTPDKAVRCLADVMKGLDRECVFVINLSKGMKPLSYGMVSMGGMDYSTMDMRNVFKDAILTNASNIIMLHSHPSGNMEPSKADVEVTRVAVHLGALLNIPVKDHVVVAGVTGECYSMRHEMPDIFDTGHDMEIALNMNNRAVAEPAAVTGEAAYSEVMAMIQRGRELMESAPEAWSLANEIAEVGYSREGMRVRPDDYKAQRFIIDAAEGIVSGNTGKLVTSLGEIGGSSEDVSLVRKAFQLVIRLGEYNGEWERAPEGLDKIFGNKPKASDREAPANMSFKDRLEAKTAEAAVINSDRAMNQSLAQKQPRQEI